MELSYGVLYIENCVRCQTHMLQHRPCVCNVFTKHNVLVIQPTHCTSISFLSQILTFYLTTPKTLASIVTKVIYGLVCTMYYVCTTYCENKYIVPVIFFHCWTRDEGSVVVLDIINLSNISRDQITVFCLLSAPTYLCLFEQVCLT